MPSSLLVRHQVEDVLARRHPGALRPAVKAVRPVRETGVPEVDALLEGGFPAGAITELTGPACSGRISLALAFVSRQTLEGQVCAWVDAADGFDPESAVASGVEMDRLLWVRCGAARGADPAGAAAASRQEVGSGTHYPVERTRETGTVCGGMHPRTEAHGMAHALGDWLLAGPVRDSVRMSGKPGTPGAVNRPLAAPAAGGGAGQVQVPTDRVPARRGEHALRQKSRIAAGETGAIAADGADGSAATLAGQAEEFAKIAPRCAETQQGLLRAGKPVVAAMPMLGPLATPMASFAARPEAARARAVSPWDRMDQVIQTTDLLLQGSGFSCIVMDLSGVDARFAHRIPLATWFRFRAAADRTRTTLLVLTRHPCTGSSGEVMLRMRVAEPGGTTVMTGVPLEVELVRQRFTGQPGSRGMEKIVSIRKPPQAATESTWCAPAMSRKAAGIAG